jgi:hypothetical protein
MGSCAVCGTDTDTSCVICGDYVCSSHSNPERHRCQSTGTTVDEVSNTVEVEFTDNSVGSVNIGGNSNQSDSSEESHSLEDLVKLKKQMDSDNTGYQQDQVILIKALEQASELKANAADGTISRTELVDDIDRLLKLIEEMDSVSANKLDTIETIQKVNEEGQSAELKKDERQKIRSAVETLEDELHLYLDN